MIYSTEEKLSALVLTPKEPSPPSWSEPTPAPNTNTTVIREPDFSPSEQFEGNPKLFEGFLLQCYLTFCRAPDTYVSDAARITYIVSALKGEALRWAHAHLRSQPIDSLSYSSFIQGFCRAFDHLLLQEEALQWLFALQQRSRSVSEFSICFQIITEESRLGNVTLKSALLKVLNDKIIDQFATHKTPQDWEELISLAIQIDNRNREQAMEKQHKSHDYWKYFLVPGHHYLWTLPDPGGKDETCLPRKSNGGLQPTSACTVDRAATTCIHASSI